MDSDKSLILGIEMMISTCIFLIFCMFSIGSVGYGQSNSFGGGLSFATNSDDAVGGIGFNAFFDHSISEVVLFKTTIGRFSSNTKVDLLSEGDYALLWIEGSLLVTGKESNIQPYIQPYGGAGGGFYMFEHSISSEVQSALNSMGVRGEEEIQNTLGIHFRGGLNIEISPTTNLNFDVKYAILKPKVEGKLTDLITFASVPFEEDVELSTLILSAGISAKF